MEERKTISAIGKRLHFGFTLIEILVVLAIISLVLGIAVPFFRGQSQRARLKGALRGTISLLEYARWLAVSNHQEIRVYLAEGCLRTGEGDTFKEYCPPSGLKVSLKDKIIFLPSGEAEEKACVYLGNDLGTQRAVCASSLSGRIYIDAVNKINTE